MFGDRVQRALESEARRCLAAALAPVPGSKALLVDDTLFDTRLSVARPLDLFTDATFLREHGVRVVSPLSSYSSRSKTDILAQQFVVVLIRGTNAAAARHAVTAIRQTREHAEALARDGALMESDDIKSDLQRSVKAKKEDAPKCLIMTTPRRSLLVERVLRMANITDIPAAVLPLGFLPFDADLITLDWPDAYRQVVLDGDNSAILGAASALSSLTAVLNVDFSVIRTAGVAAAAVAEELLETHGQTYVRRSTSAASSTISSPSQSRAASQNFLPSDAFILPESAGHPSRSRSSGAAPSITHSISRSPLGRPVTLIIVDRGVDMVSPMLTQWTYEGLLDEAVGLHNNVLDLPVSSVVSEDAISILQEAPNAPNTVRKRLRGDVDRIFAQLRDLNYWAAARQIGSIASSVRAYYDRRPTRETAEISQVKDYVAGLREVKTEHASATTHTAIAAEISARTFDSLDFKRRFEVERELIEGATGIGRRVYVTDSIARGESLSHIIRLCCLWSITSGGIDAEELEIVKREIMANFGLGVLSLLANLERAGLLKRSTREATTNNLGWIPIPRLPTSVNSVIGSNKSASTASIGTSKSGDLAQARARMGDYSWQFARAALRLVTDFDPEREVLPGTAAAVAAPYSGYTPLSVRLVEAALSDEGWSALPHVSSHNSLLPPGHATLEHHRTVQDKTHESPALATKKDDRFDAIVLVVGGLVRAEASAIRLAAKAVGVRAIIATTAVMGPDEFVLSFGDRTIGKSI